MGVVAVDQETARRAAGKVKVDYEELRALVTIEVSAFQFWGEAGRLGT